MQQQAAVPAEAIRAHLATILSSRAMANSERLRRFLHFVVERTLENGAGEIKEYSIGVEVYRKGPDFDPRTDPIVRADAARLREKLDAHYAGEGRASEWEIALPKGRYVPEFRRRQAADTTPPPPPAAALPVSPASIAVLPLANFGGDPGTDYFADGLTEELIHAMTRLPGLRVVARTSAFQFKNAQRDIREIGALLGVAFVLEGSVRPAGRDDGLRITAQLINVADGFHVWSGVFDRRPDDAVVAVQEEVAQAVAAALAQWLPGQAPRRIARQQPANPRAFDLYLRGRQGIRQWTLSGMQEGMALMRGAIEADPHYAAAYAALAHAAATLLYFGAVPASWLVTEARAAAERARSLDPTLPEVYCSVGALAAAHDHDWPAVEEAFARAMEVNPAHPETLTLFSHLLHLPLGRTGEAHEMARRAFALDPADPVAYMAHANTLQWSGRREDAAEAYLRDYERFAGMPQVAWNVGYALHAAGRVEEGIAEYRRAAALTGSDTNALLLGDLGRVLASAGQTGEARQLLAQLIDRSTRGWVPPLAIGWIHLGLGDMENAAARFEQALRERHVFLIWGAVDTRYEAVRHEPWFRKLLMAMRVVNPS